MNTGPSWTDTGTTVISPVTLGRGEVKRNTIDLRTKFGARLFLGVGRGGTAALSAGVNVEVRRIPNAGGIAWPGAPEVAYVSDTAAAYAKSINNAGGYNIGTAAFAVTGTGTSVADEDLCFWGATAVQANGAALPNLEFLRVSKYLSPTLTVDGPCKVAKINNELFTNNANLWTPWIAGGSMVEVIFDYGAAASGTGDAVAVVCYAQTYDKLAKVA